jgi:hypothetical protein
MIFPVFQSVTSTLGFGISTLGFVLWELRPHLRTLIGPVSSALTGALVGRFLPLLVGVFWFEILLGCMIFAAAAIFVYVTLSNRRSDYDL